ncbi:MAG: bifunctional 23S rRNA (guanine(2069)-N(7))-methyltransferase RlmK/23S rRNA (guanine(2445)-N(2))-methyltransferase RlmL [Desulfotalea sp.]|nr:MAG: bifunctional 23S rRNA (guanine(2069)-N(7))-methyltransferase RlmK/23S rRNA (guanine(2445)-N(2))-methyltransferase RlmL [Desulfotalea sp.]
MKMYNVVATCTTGVESLVKDEVEQFGGKNIEVEKGVVTWESDLETAYRCCLWSRFASRILLRITKFSADNEELLYEKAKEVNWQEHMGVKTSFAISCTISGLSKITHNRYAALKVKDALVDSFRDSTGERPSVKGDKPGVQFHLHLEDGDATLFVDMSGESLHRRGYRAKGTIAPLKETLGAAIVALSGWPKEAGDLVDPMCGSGTLLIEAAMMFGDSAPGLSRNYFGFYEWAGHDQSLWGSLVEEAMAREDAGLLKKWPVIIGYDSDHVAVSAAKKNIIQAGLEDFIKVRQADLATLSPPSNSGMLLANLPYGERLSETEYVARLYRSYGRIAKERFVGWRLGAFISNPELTDNFTFSWEHKYKIHNGSIPCRLLTGRVVADAEPEFIWRLPEVPLIEEKGAFANRLLKNMKKMQKWAQREQVDCYRIYHSDLPEYNFSIDLYSKWIHVQEYAPPKTVDAELSASRLRHGLEVIREVLGVRSNRIFVKRRERQKGARQYEKKDSKKKMYEVREGECSLLVNFTDYLDTGLFLDHRPVRQQIYNEAKGKRFLNLFAYTGTATVQAAMGGAASTTTVDLSSTYLDWARLNLAVNGFSEVKHKVAQGDCIEWLRASHAKFDLIFMDPPTFSNTKKDRRVFDVQRDHLCLITLAVARLDSQGMLLFSTNFRKFKLDEEVEKKYDVKEITAQTIPFDFSRNKKIHKCWEIRHKESIW